MRGSREEDFLRNTYIFHLLFQNYLILGWGVMTLTQVLKCYIPNFVTIGTVVFEKILTDDTRRQSIAIGRLSDLEMYSHALIRLYM